MKNYYQIPETELVTIGLSKLILEDEGTEQSGEIVVPEANKNDIFEDNDIVGGSTEKSNLWDN